jgi:outer membrane cobalamin receptor
MIILLFMHLQSHSQQSANSENTPFYLMSLEQLMNVDVTVASEVPMTNRESPGIVTILNHEEIINSGASDLIQLLQQVPGIDFGVDVDGVIGIGIRGNWAHEGKVLLIWDGLEMNEELYSTLQFGNHYPLDLIKKIEIIRGPGSAMYGGNAEYAVINVTTIATKDFNGVSATTYGSWMSKTFASQGISVAAGQTFGKAHINFSSSISSANRSQDEFMDAAGNSYDMTDQSAIDNEHYKVDFTYGGFSATGLFENHSIDQRDGYGAIYNRPYSTEFNSRHIRFKYDYQPNDKLTITPGVKIKYQEPWKYAEPIVDDEFVPFYTSVTKNEYYLKSSYDPNERISVISGFTYYNQNAHEEFDSVYFSNASKNLILDNYAFYVQGILKFKPINVILGSRYEYNTSYGPSFVPRLGVTKLWDKFHIKALYSRAFRAPSTENINVSPDILPEKTSVIEFEGGLNISRNVYLTANLYDITTLDPIIYYYDDNESDLYINESSTGSRGFDVDIKAKLPGWYGSFTYSYNSTAGHNVVPVYQVPDHEGKVLAFPSHEFSLNFNVQLTKKISVVPSCTYMSERFCYHETEDGTSEAGPRSPVLYTNINFNVSDLFCKGLMLQAGCFNMTDRQVLFIQPYNGNHCPLPGQGRQFQLKLSYNISFTGK